MRGRSILACGTIAVAITALATATAFAHDHGRSHNKSGFRTGQASMLDPVKAGTSVTPLMTVGDVLNSGYRFESIPDGTPCDPAPGVSTSSSTRTSKVQLPFVRARRPGKRETTSTTRSEPTEANRHRPESGGKFVIPSTWLPGLCPIPGHREEGSARHLFNNEERPTTCSAGDSWTPPTGPERGGVRLVVALASRTARAIRSTHGQAQHEKRRRDSGYGNRSYSRGRTFHERSDPRVASTPNVPAQSKPLLVLLQHKERAGHKGPWACLARRGLELLRRPSEFGTR